MMENLQGISSGNQSAIPAKLAYEYNILPIKVENEYLYIGLANKNDLKLLNDISFTTGYKIKPVEMPDEIILKKLKQLFPNASRSINKNLREFSGNSIAEYSNVELVNKIISNAIKSSASDIHFEVYEKKARIRYRIDGHLREVLDLDSTKTNSIASRIKVMANLDIAEKRRPQDGKISYRFENRKVDIRVSTLATNFGEKIVLRILDKSNSTLTLSSLGLESFQLEIFNKYIQLPYGMLLVTGPTGSGKTTTLYAVLKEIYSETQNIVTIEDPIEYNIDGINQSAVKPEIGFNFANALRTFLRQDPDIIMVGEIRDNETAEIAIRAALTGHLVFSTLHTNDSISAVTRLIDMGIEPYLVASSVKLVIAQRLVRKLCDCKIKNTFGKTDLNTKNAYRKNGCERCGFTGYGGRIGLFEIFEVNEELMGLITKNAPYSTIKKVVSQNGFKSLRDSGVNKINLGVTDYDEIIRETML